MSIQKNMRTATAFTPAANYSSNGKRNDGLLHQYFRNETKEFMKQKIPMTSALFAGEIQGVDYNDFYKWTPVKIRSSDLINPTTGEHLSDDWQEITIQNTNIDEIPIGAYVKFDDNIWIVINPEDMGNVAGKTIVKRCNCTYNTYDYYGNVVRTPMTYQKGMALASANDVKEYINLPGTYQHIIIQLNDVTKDLHNNSRMILGGQGYYLTGVTNFIREYTLDENSIHIIRAECRLGEAQHANDDLVNEVAGGLDFKWDITITGAEKMNVGSKQTLTASSLRNGCVPDYLNYPFSYIWESSDPSVISVDENGLCEATGEGTATITCFLKENTNISSSMEITASESLTGEYVEFITDLPKQLSAYDSVTVEAAYFVDGVQKPDAVTFAHDGADTNCFRFDQDGNKLTITCYAPSETPLTVRAKCSGHEASQEMMLVGY